MEPKDKSQCKAVISSIDWSVDNRQICVTYKHENVVAVWNVSTAEKIY